MLAQLLLVVAMLAASTSAAPSYHPPSPAPSKCQGFFTLPNRDLTFRFDDGFKDIKSTGDAKLDAKACWEYARDTNHYGAVLNRNGGGPAGTFRCFAKAFPAYPASQARTYYFTWRTSNDGKAIPQLESAGTYDVPGYDVETGKFNGWGNFDALVAKWSHCDLMAIGGDDTIYCKMLEKNTNSVAVFGNYCG